MNSTKLYLWDINIETLVFYLGALACLFLIHRKLAESAFGICGKEQQNMYSCVFVKEKERLGLICDFANSINY